MPLIHGHTDRSRSENIRRLIREGYPRRQAGAIAYRIQRQEQSELSDILSTDFWISPLEAKDALDAVRRSVVSLDIDMQRAFAEGKLPPDEIAEWNRYKRQFDNYYTTHTTSFADWRLLRSTAVLAEAEQQATDLGAWRQRYEHFAKVSPTTPSPVRTFAGNKSDPISAALGSLAVLGAVILGARIYRDLK